MNIFYRIRRHFIKIQLKKQWCKNRLEYGRWLVEREYAKEWGWAEDIDHCNYYIKRIVTQGDEILETLKNAGKL